MDVNEPFKVFNGLDVLDLTKEGDFQFYQARTVIFIIIEL